MPFDIPKALLDAGGWVFAAAILSGVIALILRGDLVTGAVHRREIKRADRATEQLERQADTNDDVARDLRVLLELLKGALRLPIP